MRLESARRNETKVWLTDNEVENLRRATANLRDNLIIQLGPYVGLRAFEIPQVRPTGVSETENGQYRVHVPGGKDTTWGGGNRHNVYLPAHVERDPQRYQNSQNIALSDPHIQLSTDGNRSPRDERVASPRTRRRRIRRR